MPSQSKLIKQGIQYSDRLFDEISKRLEKGVRASDTLEAFLEKTSEYTTGNPLVESGYYDRMVKLILAETNNHKFSRPAQKELVRLTIEDRVGDLIVDVGEDIKESVREVVKDGYNQNLSQDEIAANISERVSAIKGKRAKALARTEIARTATISDYIINKERGATHFYVECRNTACPVCKSNWLKNPDKETTGKGMMGDRTYSMNDTQMLPPVHPNCRCVPYFISEDDVKGPVEPVLGKRPTTETTIETTTEPTDEQLKQNLTDKEYKQHFNLIEANRESINWLNTHPDATEKQITQIKKNIAERQIKIQNLKDKALGIRKETTTPQTNNTSVKKSSISPLENYSMETLKNDLPIENKTFDKLMNWSHKRATKNKIEYGYQFDTNTGKIIGDEVRGKKGSVTFTQQGETIGSIHTHPPVEGSVGGGSFPSKQDIKVYRSQKGADHLIGSPTEIWYVHAEENLNSTVLGQREIDAIYSKVYDEVTTKGKELVNQGKLKTDDDSLRKFLDKEIGDGLLREFNTKEWQDKGFYIRRVYR